MTTDLTPSLFDDGKEPDALRTIGEVASALGIRQHVLRYWEEQFPMLRPLKRSGGRRYYRADDIALLERIDRLVHRQGYTLRGARLALQARDGNSGSPESGAVPAPQNPDADTRPEMPGDAALATQLVAIRARLAAALGA